MNSSIKLYTNRDSDYKNCLHLHPFRIFYNVGEDAKSPATLEYINSSQIPEYIINISKHFLKAYTIFTKNHKLKNPLKEGIYFDKGAKFIDIMIVDISLQKGLVSDKLVDNSVFFLDRIDMMQGESIRILLDRNLIAKTATPIHELFHVFQYNYCNFNNMWFMEGLARWSQNLTHDRKNKKEKLPQNNIQLNILLNTKHDAEYFWRELIQKCNNSVHFIRVLLEQCLIQEKILKKIENKFDKKSPLNNRYIFKAIIKTIELLEIIQDDALLEFIKVMNGYKDTTQLDELIIENTNITSLDNFNHIKTIKTLKITNNEYLTEILGFKSLKNIENIK